MTLAGKRLLFVDDQEYSVKHTMRALRTEGAHVEFDPSLADAVRRFEHLRKIEAPEMFDLVLIDLLCPPLPSSLAPYAKNAGDEVDLPGLALARYFDDQFKDKQPYALFSVLVNSNALTRTLSSACKGAVDKTGAEIPADAIKKLLERQQ